MTTENFKSLDETLEAIKAAHAGEVQALKDSLMAAQLEATMQAGLAKEAREACARAERISTALVAELGTASIVLDKARRTAIAAGLIEPNTGAPTPTADKLPEVSV